MPLNTCILSMKSEIYIYVICIIMVPWLEAGFTSVNIRTDEAISIIPDNFLSVTIDTAQVRMNWAKLNFSSTKVQALAKALSPCYIRFGGSDADFLQFSPNLSHDRDNKKKIFQPVYNTDYKERFHKEYKIEKFHGENNKEKLVKLTNFTMTAKQWDELNQFVEKVGWDLIFCLNSLLRRDGLWLSDNAKLLLDYTTKKGYKIAGWELGNEPNVYASLGYHINGSVHAKDYMILHELLKQYPQWENSIIVGPSVVGLSAYNVYKYFKDFLITGGPQLVTFPSFHHYYGYGPTMTVQKFMDPNLLNELSKEIYNAQYAIKSHANYRPIWLSETSSAWDHGAKDLSDRYVAGFMWLDKLGVSAKLGLGAVVRQDFYGWNYALIDTNTSDPNPDFWLSYLYKTLVGSKVLEVSVTEKTENLRIYAHCTNTKRTNYSTGSVTVYALNLGEEPITLSFANFFSDVQLDIYMLQPVGAESLKSQTVALNGKTLTLGKDYSMPDVLQPITVTGSVTFAMQSFGFVVIPNAAAYVCN